MTRVVGQPVDYDPDTDDVGEIVRKSHDALQALLDQANPGGGGTHYWRGIRERCGFGREPASSSS